MKNPTEEANAALDAATTRVNDPHYVARETSTKTVENMVRLASAHAQMAVARQAEITNLLQARKDFAEMPLALEGVNTKLFALLGV